MAIFIKVYLGIHMFHPREHLAKPYDIFVLCSILPDFTEIFRQFRRYNLICTKPHDSSVRTMFLRPLNLRSIRFPFMKHNSCPIGLGDFPCPVCTESTTRISSTRSFADSSTAPRRRSSFRVMTYSDNYSICMAFSPFNVQY